jgi:diaminobutyrate-2-oxoglutarate transaminase
VYDKGALLKERLHAMASAIGRGKVTVKGRGMMQGLAMPSGETAAQVVKAAYSRGLVIETSGPRDEVVKCLAALNIPDDEFNNGLDLLEEAVREAVDNSERKAA